MLAEDPFQEDSSTTTAFDLVEVLDVENSRPDTENSERTPLDGPYDLGSGVLDAGTNVTDVARFPYDRSLPYVVTGAMSCVITANGRVYCWGADRELNNSGSESELERPQRVDGLQNIFQFSLSYSTACGLDQDRAVWCWGENYAGFLQTGFTESLLVVPRRRLDIERNVEQVAVDDSNFFARLFDGSIFARQGAPQTPFRFRFSTPAVDIKAGGGSWCVVIFSGQVLCYTTGPFANGPRLVEGLEGVLSISIGRNHFCALKRDGTVWCWGANQSGQTGIPLEVNDSCFLQRHTDLQGVYDEYIRCVNRPRQVPDLADVVEVSAGGNTTCVRKGDGTVWCWGDMVGERLASTEVCSFPPWNPPSRTPSGGRECRLRPSRLASLVGATSISVADDHSCVVLMSGQVWCWGNRATGTGSPSTTPVLVPWSALSRDE